MYVTTPLPLFCARRSHKFPAQAFDQHLNLVLGDVEETISTVAVDEETFEEILSVSLPLACNVHCCVVFGG